MSIVIVCSKHHYTVAIFTVSWIQKPALQLYRKNVPLLHVKVCHSTWLSFTRPFPHVGIASVKCWDEKAWV